VTAIASDTALTMDTSETQAAGQAYTVTPTTGVSERVTTAADQGSSGNNVTQATASAKPSYRPTSGPNSRPAILFNLANHKLANGTLWDTFPAAVTVYAVVTPRGGAGTERFIVYKSNLDVQDRFFLSIDTTDKIRLFTEGGNAGNRTAFSTGTLSINSSYIATGQYLPGAALQVWLNGTAGPAGGTADAILNGTHTDFLVGTGATSAEGLGSDLAALLIYHAAHDAGQRAQVWGYLQGLFGNF
jgi:hypothetical protein